MRKEIIVKGDQDIVLSVSLLDILKQIDKTKEFIWKVLWLEATGKLKEGNIVDFEKKVNSSDNGYSIDFSELLDFAKSIDQVLEIVLIGSTKIDHLKRYQTDQEMKNTCELCIELIDSSYWEISTNDDEFVTSIASNLSGVILKG